MSGRKTERTPNRFRKSVGGGFKSLVGGTGRTFFMLEVKSSIEKFKVGETITFTSDYVELGRNANCAMRFGASTSTVSGLHASITKEGNQYIIKHISRTNPTIVNGRPVAKQWYLNNGDEIQLSMEGPRLGFLSPNNNLVNSLPMSVRMNAFAREAIRPYRQGLMALAIILIAATSALGYFLKDSYDNNTLLENKNAQLAEQFEEATTINTSLADSIKNINTQDEKLRKDLEDQLKYWKRKAKTKPKPPPPPPAGTAPVVINPPSQSNASNNNGQAPNDADLLQGYINHVYFILVDKLIVTSPTGSTEEIADYRWSGTGFLLDDGRFISARHVTEPWYFLKEKEELKVVLNIIANNGGKVTAQFTAYSPNGSSFSFSSDDFQVDRSGDEKMQMPDDQGNVFVLSIAALNDGKDWASYRTSKKGGIPANVQLSQQLKMNQEIFVLGYPFGLSLQNKNNLKPIMSKNNVAQNGLTNGMINVSNRGFDQGNSGGPAFTKINNQMYAIGIISAGIGTLGNIVPIAAAP